MTKIDIFTEGNIALPYEDINSKKLKSYLNNICKYLKIKNNALSVILCDNLYIRTINKKYRGKNRPTDVISFSYKENPFPNIKLGPEPLGDIYISLEKASENAEIYGVSLIEEIKRLLIHGVLHLTGYDHEKSEKDDRIMNEKAEEIFNHL